MSTQSPHVKLRAQPAGQLPRRSCFSCPSDRWIRSSSRAQGSPVAHPPSIPTQGWAGDGIYVRSFGDGKKKISHHTPEIAHLRFAAIATFLALNQILLREANSISLSQVLLFMSLAINWGVDGEKGTKGRWNQDLPTQHGGDRAAERGERTASGMKQGWGWTGVAQHLCAQSSTQ